MKVVVFTNQAPSTALEPHSPSEPTAASARASMRLVQYPVGGIPGDTNGAEILSELTWDQASESETVLIHPLVREIEFDLPKLFKSWLWESCIEIDLSKDREDLLNFAESMHTLFRQGQGVDLAQKAVPFLVDYGKSIPAYGEGSFRNDLIESVNRVPQKAKQISDFDAAALDLRLACNGKFVQLLRSSWNPLLAVEPQDDDYVYALDIHVGKIDGSFWIVF
ncbi:MAG: hypothetical protein ACSHYA_15360 [Opitutaceae bacterium]